MVFRRISYIAALCIAAIASVGRELRQSIEHGIDRFLAIMPLSPREPRLAFEGYANVEYHGDSLPPALLNELRHESGMKRVAAARGT